MKKNTSELLALSFDCISSPGLQLSLQTGDSRSNGWGFGWYPSDDYAASVVKDTGVKKVETITNALSDWKQFHSTTFLFKVKGAAKSPSQENTQPFQRSFWGRDWLFVHNGDLDKKKLKELIGDAEGFLQPVGTTDSELAFCFLLQQFQNYKAKKIANLSPELILSFFKRLDEMGVADIVLSDGQSFLIYNGVNSSRKLYHTRITPPHSEQSCLFNENLNLDFSDPRDAIRSAFVVSSSPLNGANWTEMSKGQMISVRRGSVIFDSLHMLVNTSTGLGSVNSKIPRKQAQQQQQQQEHEVTMDSMQSNEKPGDAVVTNIKSIVRSADGKPLEYRFFKVTHLTEYSYSKEVEHSTHVLRLQPVEDKVQEVVRSTMSFSARGEQLFFEDVFGNHSIHVTVDNPYSKLSMKVESEVKIYASPIDDFSNTMRRTSIPLVWMPWQRQMMLPYLLPPELPEPQLLELTEYAMSFVERADYNLVDTLAEMNQQIFQDYKYVQGETNLSTTPFDVYSTRKGVCQDFANLFICLARLLNIPARYRVGYIHTGSNYENKVQSEASHAWVEVYLPYLGWRGFDPTNGCLVGQEHIRVACGRNFRDAAPTTGTLYKGGAGESLFVSVKVESLNQ